MYELNKLTKERHLCARDRLLKAKQNKKGRDLGRTLGPSTDTDGSPRSKIMTSPQLLQQRLRRLPQLVTDAAQAHGDARGSTSSTLHSWVKTTPCSAPLSFESPIAAWGEGELKNGQ